MKQTSCYYACDKAGCPNESQDSPTFTEARKAAVGVGWIIHPPSGEMSRQICPSCASEMLAGLGQS